MDLKANPNHRIYIETLRRMSPEARLRKACELSAFTKKLFMHGLRRRFPDQSEQEIRRIMLDRLEKCHNRRY
jgi:hypothetical protein